jgi:transposase
MTMSCDDAGISGVQRFEVFTGAGKRRDWPPEVKISIVAESYSGSETISAVARRHGMSPSQLFTWRRELRKQIEVQGLALPVAPVRPPLFVPAVVEPPAGNRAPVAKRGERQRRSSPGVVELVIDGVAVKIGRGADERLVRAVIGALKAAR